MSLHNPGTGHPRLLPDQIEERLKSLFNQLAGVLLVALMVLVWGSLLTWSHADPILGQPALGQPSQALTSNAFGALGAGISDLMLHAIGFVSVFAVLPFGFWGVSMVRWQRVQRWRTKLVLWLASIAGLTGALAAIPTVAAWPLRHGFGGFFGDFVYAIAAGALSALNPTHGGTAAGLFLFAGGAAALLASLGAGAKELTLIWQGGAAHGIGRGSVTVVHAAVSTAWTDPSGKPQTRTEPKWVAAVKAELADRWHHAVVQADARLGGTSPMRPAAPGKSHGAPGRAASGPVAAHAPDRHYQSHWDERGDPRMDAGSRHEARHDPRYAARQPRHGHAGGPGGADHAARQKPQPGQNPWANLLGDGQEPDDSDAMAQRFAAKPAPPPKGARGFFQGFRAQDSRSKPAEPDYRRPSLNILKRPAGVKPAPEFAQTALRGVARLLEDVLLDFGVKGQIHSIKPGPVVTLYELEPARGLKASRIIGLADDIARSMSATSARVAAVPGRNVIGIELPNMRRETVYLRELLEADAYKSMAGTLPLVLGKSIGGEPVIADLARMPHLLVAGTTGSGKSVGLNAMILSLLYKLGPEHCRFIMIDPKMLELSVYNGIPHLLTPVITDPQRAVAALNWVVREMEERYKRMAQLAVRNIDVFNNRVRHADKAGEPLSRTVQTGFDQRTGQAIYEKEMLTLEPIPYIVVVVDEMADLMLTAGKDIEGAVQRLAQMARAAGIHLIMATQRPSVDVITGTIKANFPTRASFKVTSKIDSRTILGEQGAEQLLGAGDMLFAVGAGQIVRVHGPFVSDEEVEQVASYLRSLGEPNYVQGLSDEPRAAEGPGSHADGIDPDEIYDKAVAVVIRDRKASTSYIQRRLSIGYNRAAGIMERMEQEGLVSPANSVGKRHILLGDPEAGSHVA